jgi:hypothetical protein
MHHSMVPQVKRNYQSISVTIMKYLRLGVSLSQDVDLAHSSGGSRICIVIAFLLAEGIEHHDKSTHTCICVFRLRSYSKAVNI